MGTHPSGPARLQADEGTTLNAWLDAHPAALGEAVRQRFGNDLPFLFKACSRNQGKSTPCVSKSLTAPVCHLVWQGLELVGCMYINIYIPIMLLMSAGL